AGGDECGEEHPCGGVGAADLDGAPEMSGASGDIGAEAERDGLAGGDDCGEEYPCGGVGAAELDGGGSPNDLDGRGSPSDLESALSEIIAGAGIDHGQRNVIVTHQFYTAKGTHPIRSESELSPVGGLDAVDAAVLSPFDYAALGHLHGGQTVGSDRVRYCGSPVRYSFSEWRQQKSVTLVELGPKGRVSVRELPLAPIRGMRELRGRLADLLDAARLEGPEADDYIKVTLTDEGEVVDPMGKLRAVYKNILGLAFDNARTRVDLSALASVGAERMAASPLELFEGFFTETQGSAMTAEQRAIVAEAMEAMELANAMEGTEAMGVMGTGEAIGAMGAMGTGEGGDGG
ncbi:MAG: exonuclease SbcCD subunit D C-terminal domain-containing protein, partial [Oscillospiraceae bacterium]|nr:exonuclease SbcCD subunit D C-terminal domain-containing protein [Oscillospiraceae bacterium]